MSINGTGSAYSIIIVLLERLFLNKRGTNVGKLAL